MKKSLTRALALCGAATPMLPLAAQEAQKPNIIFFLTDDQGWQDTSLPFWSQVTPLNQRYRTPNMERLAARGVKFTDAYACPVSSPSRCSLISGMNAARHGVTNWIERYGQNTNASGGNITLPQWNWNGVQPEATATANDRRNSCLITPLPQLLHDAGYYTIHCGKGNFGAQGTSSSDPLTLGNDVNIAGGYAGGPGSYLAQDNYGSAIQAIGGLEKYAEKGVFLSEALTQEAIKRMRIAHNNGKPFYLYMSHYAIHTPYQADSRFTGNYGTGTDPLLGAVLNSSEINRAALIEGMDKSLGDIMDFVEGDSTLARNTIIIFMSDNGGQGVSPRQGQLNRLQNYPARGGKGSAYEGGVHEPMIVSWPGHYGEGVRSSSRVMIEDFFPSILEMAGVDNYETVQKVDGQSFVPCLTDTSLCRDRANIWHYPNRWGECQDKSEGYGAYSAIMKGDYHLIYFWENQERRLYNIREDIGEQHNLASTQPELTMQLAQELTDSLKAFGALRPKTLAGVDVPWPVDGQLQASTGDAVPLTSAGVVYSTDSVKHLYTVQDNRPVSSLGPFYWTLGTHYNYPAVQVTNQKKEGDEALSQQFYFMPGSDDLHFKMYTADGRAVSYTQGTALTSLSATTTGTYRYLQYGVGEPTEFQAILSGYSGYLGVKIDGEYLSDRGSSHGNDVNMAWVVMPYAGGDYADPGCRYKFVSTEVPRPNLLPLLQEEGKEPQLYRMKNVRTGKYISFSGSLTNYLPLVDDSVADAWGDEVLFYFTGTEQDGVQTVRIHNVAAGQCLIGRNSWSAEGDNWYVRQTDDDSGILLSRNADFSGSRGWYAANGGAYMDYGNATSSGSVWVAEALPPKAPELPQLSESKDRPVLYRVRNVRSGKYAAFSGNLTAYLPVVDTAEDESSLFYFTGSEENGVQTIKIYNVKAGMGLKGRNSWSTEGDTWYARLNDAKTGIIISKNADFSGNRGWCVKEGGTFVDYGTSEDEGSAWVVEPTEGENTAIHSARTGQDAATPRVYDLEGRRVTGTPRRGLYIIDGKKVIKK